jgi:hypothetical protein
VQMPRRMATSPLTVALGLHSGLPGGVGELGRDGKLNLTTTKPQTMLLAIQPVGPQVDDEWSSQPQCASLRPLVPMDGSAMLAPSVASALIPIVPDSISSITPAASQRLRAAGSNNKSLALLTDCVTSGTDGGAVQSALVCRIAYSPCNCQVDRHLICFVFQSGSCLGSHSTAATAACAWP